MPDRLRLLAPLAVDPQPWSDAPKVSEGGNGRPIRTARKATRPCCPAGHIPLHPELCPSSASSSPAALGQDSARRRRWSHVKFDGYRVQAHKGGECVGMALHLRFLQISPVASTMHALDSSKETSIPA